MCLVGRYTLLNYNYNYNLVAAKCTGAARRHNASSVYK